LIDRDGDNVSGNMWCPKTKIADAEVHEALYPILTLYRKEVPDTAGIGKFRGGNALETAFMPWDAGSELTNVGLSHGFEARVGNGTSGGYPAPNITMHLIRNSDVRAQLENGRLPRNSDDIIGERDYPYPKSFWKLGSDDVSVYLCGGGGGYGDPLDRDPEMVLKDVKDGEVTIEYAETAYGVVIDPKTLKIDVTETERIRKEMYDERLKEGKV